MRYPDFLKPNGSIGFVAPSFGCTSEPYISRFAHALESFKAAGYETVVGPNAYTEKGVGKSNTPEACAQEVNDFFVNEKADIIISCGGGETMCEDLPYIDFEGIAKARPTWYMGYSDNTNLTYTLPVFADTAAIYGPCVSDFGKLPLHDEVKDALAILTGEKLSAGNYPKWELEKLDTEENPFAPINATEPFSMVVYDGCKLIETKEAEISFEGRLIGGCLDCLKNLLGTRFDGTKAFNERYCDDGIIWFMESCELNVMDIRRALWQLKEAGWFKYVKGFLIGRPMLFNDTWGDYTHINAVVDMLGEFGVPILMDLDIGHLPPMMPVISGACCKVAAKGNSVSLEYRLK